MPNFLAKANAKAMVRRTYYLDRDVDETIKKLIVSVARRGEPINRSELIRLALLAMKETPPETLDRLIGKITRCRPGRRDSEVRRATTNGK